MRLADFAEGGRRTLQSLLCGNPRSSHGAMVIRGMSRECRTGRKPCVELNSSKLSRGSNITRTSDPPIRILTSRMQNVSGYLFRRELRRELKRKLHRPAFMLCTSRRISSSPGYAAAAEHIHNAPAAKRPSTDHPSQPGSPPSSSPSHASVLDISGAIAADDNTFRCEVMSRIQHSCLAAAGDIFVHSYHRQRRLPTGMVTIPCVGP